MNVVYVDDCVDPLRYAMGQLKKSMRGMPAQELGFRGAYNRFAHTIAYLVLSLEEAAEAACRQENPGPGD